MNDSQSSEILIIGGGLVGLTLALALSAQGFSVKLVDQHPFNALDPTDNRSLVLSFSSVEFLKTLAEGKWWKKLEPSCTPIAHLHVSEAGTLSILRLHAQEYGENAFGYVVPISVLYSGLWEAVLEQKIDVLSSSRVLSVQAEDGLVTLENGQKLQASLVLACDGGNSFVREHLKLKTEKYDYGQSALVTSVLLPSSTQSWAFERFLPEGILALLPLPQNSCGVVWVQPPEKTQIALKLSDTEFLNALQENFGKRLGTFLRIGPRHTYPLQKIIAQETHRGRVLLMGNSAHQLNPVGAQGWNLALRDIALLLKLIDRNVKNLSSTNVSELLEKLLTPYETLRKADQIQIEKLTHSMAIFYGSQDPLSILSRRFTMTGLRWSRTLRERFVFTLMGKKAYRQIQEVPDAL